MKPPHPSPVERTSAPRRHTSSASPAKRRGVAVLAAAVLVPCGAAFAAGVTPWIAAISDAAAAAESALAGDAPRLKAARSVTKRLAKPGNTKSLAAELEAVATAARTAETQLADQVALLQAFDGTFAGYTADLVATRGNLAAAAEAASIPEKIRKRHRKALARFDAARALVGKAPSVPTPRADRLRTFSAAAKAGAGFTPYDTGTTYTWVLSSVALADEDTGLDLDGDRTPDNDFAALATLLGTLGLDIEGLLANAFAQTGTFTILQTWQTRSLTKPDTFVLTGVISATDADADATNDFSGSGAFVAVGGATAPDGRASLRVAATLGRRGKYTIDFAGSPFAVGGFSLPSGSLALMAGTATPTSNRGIVGIGLPRQAILDLLAEAGVTLDATGLFLLGTALDLDLDPDVPGADAISMALTFEGVPATVVAP